jgi:hypothetical protein
LLGILSHGEAEAWAYVMGLSPGAAVSVDAPADDATRLAASFRALALALCALLAHAKQFALPGPRSGWSSHRISGPAVRWRGVPAAPAPDT